jgi:Raf kinase inhibitor-like YbhB/YbcL family protein
MKRRVSGLGPVGLLAWAGLGLTIGAGEGCRGTAEASAASALPKPTMPVSSAAFADGATIPTQYTCSGDNVSPALSWSGAPSGTRSVAIILDDPDAPGGLFTHWLLWGVAPTTTSLDSHHAAGTGEHEGKNDMGKTGYKGPCPPAGAPHHYLFHVFALDEVPDLADGSDRAAVDKALAGHVLADGLLTGLFGR